MATIIKASSSVKLQHAARPRLSPMLATLPVRHARKQVRDVTIKAAQPAESPLDFDSILSTLAEKFERAENKPAVVGYLSAAVAAVFLVEYIIHLPVLDILLGWPIQLLGVFSMPVLAFRYYLQKNNDITEDLTGVVNTVTKELPGFKKE